MEGIIGKEIYEKVVAVNRVAKKIAGGERIGFTALVAVGDKKGGVGVASGKAPNLKSAIDKATARAKKEMFAANLRGTTIPYAVKVKEGAAKLILKPAPRGAGLIAGGVLRDILELAGVRDISAKILGTSNKVSNAQALIKALKSLKVLPR